MGVNKRPFLVFNNIAYRSASAVNAAGDCARPGCGQIPSQSVHQHAVAMCCDASHEEDRDCHRFVCKEHGRGGDIDFPSFGFPFSFCGRCAIQWLLENP